MPEEKASGAKVSRFGGCWVGGGARGPRVGVCVPAAQAATYFSAVLLGHLLNKTYKRKPWLRSA